MKKLHISDKLSLPLDWIGLATVVYGARGAGKTCFGRVAAEEAHKARQRFCAIDLKGDWYGLTSSADGKGEGIPVVIFGGESAHVPLEPDAGAFVGETVAKLEQSCILDFELLSKGKQIRFLAEFFEALYHHNREPLLLLLDEAQRYAPQKPGPDEARTLGAVQDLVKLGRKHGIGPVLFTQRGAGLNKEVSELCDMLVAFRTPGPLDQGRIEDWLNANTTAEDRDSVMPLLAKLETGQAVFASGHPDLKTFGLYNVRRPETFDSSATPKIGQSKKKPKKLAEPDLNTLRTRMSAAIERAKADDPKALRAKIRELEAELAKKKTVAVTQIVVKEVPAKVDWKIVKQSAREQINSSMKALNKCLDVIIEEASKNPMSVLERYAPKDDVRAVPAGAVTMGRKTAKAGIVANGASTELAKGERIVLIAIAQHPNGVTKEQLSVLTAYKATSRNVYLRKLNAGGYSEPGNNGTIKVTQEGIDALGDFEPLPTGRELLAHWLDKLPEGERRILEVVVNAFPGSVERSEIDEATGYKATSRNVYLRKLSARKLVVSTHGGPVRMSEELS